MTNFMFKRQEKNASLIFLSTCLLLAYLLPFHFFPFPAFYSDALAIFGLGIGFSFISGKQTAIISLPWIVFLPIVLIILIALQTFMGMLVYREDAFLPIAYFIIASLAIIFGASISARESRGATKLCAFLSWAFLIAGFISTIIAIIQFAGLEAAFSPFILSMKHDPRAAIRPVANLGQPNNLALLCCFALASVWLLYQIDHLSKWISLAATLCLIFGLVLTQSRIGWVIAPIFSLTLYFWQKKSSYKKIYNWIFVGLILCYVVLIILLPILASAFEVSVSSAAQRIDTQSNSQRLAMIKQAWDMSITHPWFGVGWYQFGTQQLTMASDISAPYSNYAHNVVMNFAAELGWPVTSVIILILAYWTYRLFFHLQLSREVGFAALFLTAISVHSMVEYPLWYGFVLVPTALLMGMAHHQQIGAGKIILPRIFTVLVFITISACLVGVAKDYRRLMLAFRSFEVELMGGKLVGVTSDKPSFTLFPQFYDYFLFAKTEPKPDMSRDQIIFSERVASTFADPTVMMDMVSIYALNGLPDQAIKTMTRMSRMSPCRYTIFYKQVEKKAHSEADHFEHIFKLIPLPNPTDCK